MGHGSPAGFCLLSFVLGKNQATETPQKKTNKATGVSSKGFPKKPARVSHVFVSFVEVRGPPGLHAHAARRALCKRRGLPPELLRCLGASSAGRPAGPWMCHMFRSASSEIHSKHSGEPLALKKTQKSTQTFQGEPLASQNKNHGCSSSQEETMHLMLKKRGKSWPQKREPIAGSAQRFAVGLGAWRIKRAQGVRLCFQKSHSGMRVAGTERPDSEIRLSGVPTALHACGISQATVSIHAYSCPGRGR